MPDRDDPDYFTANVFVDVSPTFFAWVSTFGRQLKIVAPQETVDKFAKFLHGALDQY